MTDMQKLEAALTLANSQLSLARARAAELERELRCEREKTERLRQELAQSLAASRTESQEPGGGPEAV